MSRSIRQSGTGTAVVVPDLVRARIGVYYRAADVRSAFDGAGEAARALVAAVIDAGVVPADVATTDVGLTAVETGPWEDRRIEGYAATETLTIAVRQTDRAAQVLQAAAAGAKDAARIESVSFVLGDDTAARSQARELAFDAARVSAQHYAELSGATLGQVVTVSDERETGRPVAAATMSTQRMMASGPAMAPGEHSVTEHVTVQWELLD